MNNSEELSFAQQHSAAPKKSRAALFALIIVCFFSITAFLCHTFYSAKKEEILAAQQERLQVNAVGTADSIGLWASGLDAQARRISDAELYRLFASDVSQLDAQKAAMLNDPEAAAMLGEDVAPLVEQLPLMRTVLLDFMNYNGLQDARVVSPDGQVLISSLVRPSPLLDTQLSAIRESIKNNLLVFGPVRGTSTGLVLDYAAPLLPVQSGEEGSKPVAAIMLTVPVTGQVAQFMARGTGPGQQFTARLLQKNGGRWECIRLNAAQPTPVDAKAAPDAQGILPFALRPAVDGDRDVYSLAMRVPGINWTLVQEIPAKIVDGQLQSAFNVIYGMGLLLCLGVLLLLALLWWVMVGREQRSVAQRFEKLYHVIRQQKHLLDSINVSLDVGLLMADTSGTLQVVNRAFARIVEKDEELLPGQSLSALFGGQVAGQLQDAIRRVADADHPETIEITLPLQQEARLFRVTLFPFVEKGVDGGTRGAVVTLQDITEFRRNSENRRKQQLQTIEALVGAIERVDPYLTGHSRMMRRLSELMCEHLHLDGKDKDTLTTAASLSQIGKIFVPRHLLAKTEKLTPEELAELARVPEYGYSVLRNIDFGMPVPTAILQMYEKLDGSGTPNSMQGEDISLHGRVLAVVNTFCAMVSPRSFRSSLAADVALDNLRKQSDAYDQRVVDALAAVLATPEGAHALAVRQSESRGTEE